MNDSIAVDPEENFSQNEKSEVNNFSYDQEKGSYEFDVDDDDPDWEHPSDYNTVSRGADDDSSEYDSSNPFVGSEYLDLDDLETEELHRAGMRITDKKDLKISKLDKFLSNDEEDERFDLDDEGYPLNDEL